MKKILRCAMGLKWLVCLSIGLAGSAHALLPLSNVPLFLGGNISPNVMFTLDDSGSMQDEILPDESIYSFFLFPRAPHVYSVGLDNSNYVPTFADGFSYSARMRSPRINPLYYNPAKTYLPWSNSDGSFMPNAEPDKAYHNPAKPDAGYRDLTINNAETAYWSSCNDEYFDTCSEQLISETFYPAVYFYFNGVLGNVVDEWDWTKYVKQEIRSATPTYYGHGRDGRTDCSTGTPVTCTYNQEIHNFANWYTYYRSRILLARAGIGQAFAAQGNTMRVGFAAINTKTAAVPTIDGMPSAGAVINGVRQFTGTDRINFFNSLYTHDMPAAGTPLREALDRVGKYFQRDDVKGPWAETPGTGGGTPLACRQTYNILMTDGYWNGIGPTGIGNSDNPLTSTLITNHSSPAIPVSYLYVPKLPYSDQWKDTLADVAMHYWKTDLRDDLLNKVPTNSTDPAFWQHMVTFTVGLGVSGTLADTQLPSDLNGIVWPDPFSGSQEKIDDLRHAAVNSRGNFYSAADPAKFVDALKDALTKIVANTGSASAVAANSGSLITNGRIYQTKFESKDWAGELLSIPIDAGGMLKPVEWNTGASDGSLAPGKFVPANRVIITKGNGGGVPFEYAKLTPAQQGLLDTDIAGTVDTCGLERVAYLRGDAGNEGGGTFKCASPNIINKFRSRPVSKLGDIINSGPFYVGRPKAGYSDMDQAGYAAFSTLYKDRTPVVYVGANDGMLHGFNACTVDNCTAAKVADGGKELIAYVPGMVYGNLNRLSDKNYNASHRYFVDGSPMVADAYVGVTPQWKSVLVGGLNGGGQGYYALDITDPDNFTATNANAANLLLWEFTNADDADMGYSYNLPAINSFTGQSSQIVKMANNKWAVVVGNGYNSAGGKAALYVLFMTGGTGTNGAWTVTDYKKLVADAGTGNGLSTPMPFDSNGDGLIDVIYAGDIKGNLWKFDVSDANTTNWKTALSGAPLFVPGTSKPIISPPVVTLHPNGGQLVMFGTGKYLETGDTTTTNIQTMYGVWDYNSTASVTSADLVKQVVQPDTSNPGFRTASNYAVPYSATGKKGWYIDLPDSGERLTAVPTLENGVFLFTTIVPSVSPCDFGGKGFVNAVDYLTGGMLSFPAFDTSNKGVVVLSDAKSAGMATVFASGGVTRIRGGMNDALIIPGADGGLKKEGIYIDPKSHGRITWRELVQ